MTDIGQMDTVRHAERELVAKLSADAVVTEGARLADAARLWNGAVTKRPAIVVRCRSTRDVQVTVQVAREVGLPLSVRGGGHDWTGRAVCDQGIVVDLTRMRAVDVSDEIATVWGGATVSDVLDIALPTGLSAALGTIGSVGVVGLTLGGGYGPLIGVRGMSVDNMLGATVVTASGRVVDTSPTINPDLFWALQGGGGNFGVVTELRVRLHPIPEVTTGMIAFGWAQARSVLSSLSELVSGAEDALDVTFGVLNTPGGLVVLLNPTWAGAAERGDEHMLRMRALGDPAIDQVDRMTLAAAVRLNERWAVEGASYFAGTRSLPNLDGAALEAFLGVAEQMPDNSLLMVHHAHGAATRVPATQTAFAQRHEHLVVEIIGSWRSGDGAAERAWVGAVEDALDPYALPGGWASLMASDDQRARLAYGGNVERLREIKRLWDPDRVFSAIPLPFS